MERYIVFAILCLTASFISNADTVVSGSVSGTWDLAGSPYIVTGVVTIDTGDILTIEPGVVVKFNDPGFGYRIVVNGTLIADGTPANKIQFTSNAGTHAAGDWEGIIISSNESSLIDNCIIEYSGNGISIFSYQNSTTITSSYFLSCGVGIYEEGGGVKSINGCTFNGNVIGVILWYSDMEVTNNIFDSNTNAAISIVESYPVFSGNTATNNGRNGIVIDRPNVDTGGTWKAELPFIVEGYEINVNPGVTLTIGEGSTFKFLYGGIKGDGAVIVSGTAENPVIFTSLYDDIICDSNNDGSATTPSWGDYFACLRTDSVSVEYAEFRYGELGIYIQNGTLSVSNSIFRDCGVDANNSTGIVSGNIFDLCGLYASNSSTLKVTGCIFRFNYSGVHIDDTSIADLGNLNDADLTNDGDNTFICNTVHIRDDNPSALMAENNYIGNDPPNASKIIGNVDYDPWLSGPSVEPVQHLMSSVSTNDVVLDWSDQGTPTCGYIVYRGTSPDRALMTNQSGIIFGSGWTDLNVGDDGIDYYYDLRVEGD